MHKLNWKCSKTDGNLAECGISLWLVKLWFDLLTLCGSALIVDFALWSQPVWKRIKYSLLLKEVLSKMLSSLFMDHLSSQRSPGCWVGFRIVVGRSAGMVALLFTDWAVWQVPNSAKKTQNPKKLMKQYWENHAFALVFCHVVGAVTNPFWKSATPPAQ